MVDTTPLNFGSTPGQKNYVQNTGVKRILGTNLVGQGKISNWVFYLEDIKSMVVWANDGTDVWFSAIGQPAAGNLAFRDSLTPFEGQRFYVIEQDIAYEYKGGSWTGTVFEGNLVSPTYLTLDEPTSMTMGRKHLLADNGTFVLPTDFAKEGHEVEFEIVTGFTVVITAQDGSELIIGDASLPSTTGLNGATGIVYRCVYHLGQWNIFFTDAGDLIKAIDAIVIGKGLIKTGNAVSGNMALSVDFATDEEAEDVNIDDKAISPKTVMPSVNAATRANQHNNITGLLPKTTDPIFNITGNIGDNFVTYTLFTAAFNLDPYLRNTPLEIIDFTAGTLNIPNIVGVSNLYIVARNDNTVVIQNTRPLPTSVTECLLGAVVAVNGLIIDDGTGNPSVGVFPWLASSYYDIRNAKPTVSGGIFSASATPAKVGVTNYTINSEGVNWENSQLLPHTKTLIGVDPAVWSVVDRDGNVLGIGVDEIDGRTQDDGTPIPSNDYSIQVMFANIEGNLILLPGQSNYMTLDEARADVFAYAPIIPSIGANWLELSRWIVKGDQYSGGPQLDLTDPDNYQTFNGLDIVLPTQSNNAQDITSSNTDNNLKSTNLQEQIDELSQRGQIEDLLLQNIESSHTYRIAFNGTKKLPTANPAGQIIGFYARPTDLAGVLEVNDTDNETIFFASEPSVTDTQLGIDTAGVIYYLRSLGTSWEITNA